ncbi:MAG TPA: hypothetical protein PKD54_09545, partial [Pirellulaceae bacterium]|nr:hypothetical protein [Pirellulaceae bacterium]
WLLWDWLSDLLDGRFIPAKLFGWLLIVLASFMMCVVQWPSEARYFDVWISSDALGYSRDVQGVLMQMLFSTALWSLAAVVTLLATIGLWRVWARLRLRFQSTVMFHLVTVIALLFSVLALQRLRGEIHLSGFSVLVHRPLDVAVEYGAPTFLAVAIVVFGFPMGAFLIARRSAGFRQAILAYAIYALVWTGPIYALTVDWWPVFLAMGIIQVLLISIWPRARLSFSEATPVRWPGFVCLAFLTGPALALFVGLNVLIWLYSPNVWVADCDRPWKAARIARWLARSPEYNQNNSYSRLPTFAINLPLDTKHRQTTAYWLAGYLDMVHSCELIGMDSSFDVDRFIRSIPPSQPGFSRSVEVLNSTITPEQARTLFENFRSIKFRRSRLAINEEQHVNFCFEKDYVRGFRYDTFHSIAPGQLAAIVDGMGGFMPDGNFRFDGRSLNAADYERLLATKTNGMIDLSLYDPPSLRIALDHGFSDPTYSLSFYGSFELSYPLTLDVLELLAIPSDRVTISFDHYAKRRLGDDERVRLSRNAEFISLTTRLAAIHWLSDSLSLYNPFTARLEFPKVVHNWFDQGHGTYFRVGESTSGHDAFCVWPYDPRAIDGLPDHIAEETVALFFDGFDVANQMPCDTTPVLLSAQSFSRFRKLRKLELPSWVMLEDYSVLSTLPELTELHLCVDRRLSMKARPFSRPVGEQLTTALRQMPNLKVLYLETDAVELFESLSGLSSLERLHIGDANLVLKAEDVDQILDLLRHMPNLHEFSLATSTPSTVILNWNRIREVLGQSPSLRLTQWATIHNNFRVGDFRGLRTQDPDIVANGLHWQELRCYLQAKFKATPLEILGMEQRLRELLTEQLGAADTEAWLQRVILLWKVPGSKTDSN